MCVCVYVHTHNFAVKCKITFVICLVNYYFNYHVDFTVSVLLSGAKIVFSSQTFSWPFTSSQPLGTADVSNGFAYGYFQDKSG